MSEALDNHTKPPTFVLLTLGRMSQFAEARRDWKWRRDIGLFYPLVSQAKGEQKEHAKDECMINRERERSPSDPELRDEYI